MGVGADRVAAVVVGAVVGAPDPRAEAVAASRVVLRPTVVQVFRVAVEHRLHIAAARRRLQDGEEPQVGIAVVPQRGTVAARMVVAIGADIGADMVEAIAVDMAGMETDGASV